MRHRLDRRRWIRFVALDWGPSAHYRKQNGPSGLMARHMPGAVGRLIFIGTIAIGAIAFLYCFVNAINNRASQMVQPNWTVTALFTSSRIALPSLVNLARRQLHLLL